MSFSHTVLPIEIVDLAVARIGVGRATYSTLKSCALTCKHLVLTSQSSLFHEATFNHPAPFKHFVEVVSLKPKLGLLVCTLNIDMANNPADPSRKDSLPFPHPAILNRILPNLDILHCTMLPLFSHYPPGTHLLISHLPIQELSLIDCDLTLPRLLPLLWLMHNLRTLRLSNSNLEVVRLDQPTMQRLQANIDRRRIRGKHGNLEVLDIDVSDHHQLCPCFFRFTYSSLPYLGSCTSQTTSKP